MFNFLKKNKDSEEDIVDLFDKLEKTSLILRLQLQTGDLKWTDKEIQSFIPIILHFTDLNWLDIIAKETGSNYEIIHEFLEKTNRLVKTNIEQYYEEA